MAEADGGLFLLYVAYTAIWGGVFAYLAYLHLKQGLLTTAMTLHGKKWMDEEVGGDGEE